MFRKKLIVSIIITGTVAASALAWGVNAGAAGHHAATASAKPVHIAFFSESIANAYTHQTQLAIQKVAAQNGATVQVFDGNFNARTQFSQVQDAITSGKFNAFLAVPVDFAGIVPAVAQAKAKGIKYGTISFPTGSNDNTTKPQVPGQWVAVLDPAAYRGKWIGQLIVKACVKLNPCNVAYLNGGPGIPYENFVTQAVNAQIAGHSNISIVATGTGGYLATTAQATMANLLVAHSNINVVAGDGDQDIEGAIVALKARGKVIGTTGSDVRLIGLGASQASVAGIRAGTWFGTALSLPYTEGQLAAQYIIRAVRGTLKAPIGVSAALSSGINPEVSKANLPSTFKAQWIG